MKKFVVGIFLVIGGLLWAESISYFDAGVGSNCIRYFTDNEVKKNWDVSIIGSFKAGRIFENNVYVGGEIQVGGMIKYAYPNVTSFSPTLNFGYVWGGQNKRWSFYTGVAVGYYGQITSRRIDTGEKGVVEKEYKLFDASDKEIDNVAVAKETLKKEGKDKEIENWKYAEPSTIKEEIVQTNDAVNSFILGIDLFYNYKITDNWSLKVGGRVSYIRTYCKVYKDKEQFFESEIKYNNEVDTTKTVLKDLKNACIESVILQGISIVPTISVSYTF